MSNERFWEQVLPLLEEERVIPVVGQDLLVVEVDGRKTKLYAHLARRLAEKFGLEGEAPSTLNEFACRYLADRRPLEDIYPALKQEVARLQHVNPPGSLLRLAEMDWFKLFVSTTFDDFLWKAVDEVRCGGARLAHSLAYALNNDFKDLPDDLPNLQRPAVYHLFGRVSAIQDTYAVTDEDLLEFVHNLQIEDRRPRRLFDAFASNHLLLVGSGFSPWLVRFFLRAVKHRERLWQVRGRAGFVVDQAAREDAGLIGFLQHFSDRTLVYSAGEAAEFVDELWNRWRQRRRGTAPSPPSGPSPQPVSQMPRHAVFLSYASEDRAIVDRIKEQLDEAGIDAWFDRAELQPGGSWAQVIRANIDSSAAFVPIISASAQRPGAREFRVEWELALEVRKRRPREPDGTPARFIVPVVIDGTGMQEDGVRPYFGDIHGVNLPGGQLSDEFCAKLRELVRHAQLASEIPR